MSDTIKKNVGTLTGTDYPLSTSTSLDIVESGTYEITGQIMPGTTRVGRVQIGLTVQDPAIVQFSYSLLINYTDDQVRRYNVGLFDSGVLTTSGTTAAEFEPKPLELQIGGGWVIQYSTSYAELVTAGTYLWHLNPGLPGILDGYTGVFYYDFTFTFTVRPLGVLFDNKDNAVDFNNPTDEQTRAIEINQDRPEGQRLYYDGKDGVDVVVLPTAARAAVIGYSTTGHFQAGKGNDVVTGHDLHDFIWGEDGDDSLDGGAGNDTLMGGDGRDTLIGGAGDDTLIGESLLPVQTEGQGRDSIVGGAGNDLLLGGGGDDFLEDGDFAGSDTFYGGPGNDIFVVNDGDFITSLEEGDLVRFNGAGSLDSVMITTDPGAKSTTIYQLENDAAGFTYGRVLTIKETIDPSRFRVISLDVPEWGLSGTMLHLTPAPDDATNPFTAVALEPRLAYASFSTKLQQHMPPALIADVVTGIGSVAASALVKSALANGLPAAIKIFAKNIPAVKAAEIAYTLGTVIGAEITGEINSTNRTTEYAKAISGLFIPDLIPAPKAVAVAFQYAWGSAVAFGETVVDYFSERLLIETKNLMIDLRNAFRLFEAGGGGEVPSGTRIIIFGKDLSLPPASTIEEASLVTPNATAETSFFGTAGENTFLAAANAAGTVVDGRGGFDRVSYAALGGGVTVNLVDGSASGPAVGAHRLASIEAVSGSTGADILRGSTASNHLEGNEGSDLLVAFAGRDTLDGGAGADRLLGGPGNDFYIVDQAGDSVVELAGNGADTVLSSADHVLAAHVETLILEAAARTGTGNTLANLLKAGTTAALLRGLAGADTLDGSPGGDTLDGGASNDVMRGGGGSDRYIVDSAKDVVVEALHGGDDTVVAWTDFVIPAHVEALVLAGKAKSGMGSARADLLIGNAQANRLVAGSGNDTLNGAAGADSLYGGPGDDLYYVDHAGDLVVEAAGAGKDRVVASLNYVLMNQFEDLSLIGTARNGTGNQLANSMAGNALANTLWGLGGNDSLAGGAGDDLLDGGAGQDYMEGGAGNDRFIVDDLRDTVHELKDGGDDLVIAYISHTLSDNVERLSLAGQARTGTGNALANVIAGNAQNNRLEGLDGADILYGGQGSDVLDGGLGADSLYGGPGNDSYVVDHLQDRIVEAADAGTSDRVMASVNYRMPLNIETLTLTGAARVGIGNAQANTIEGNTWNDLIRGLDGDDRLNGGDGADTLVGGRGYDGIQGGDGDDRIEDVDGGVFWGGAGDDTIVLGAPGATEAIGTTANGDEGNDVIDASAFALVQGSRLRLTGGAGHDQITGSAGPDDLSGQDGNDVLAGGAGIDFLAGGDGNDTLIGGAGQDFVTGNAGADVFAFRAIADFTAGFEEETLQDFSAAQGDRIDLSAIDANANAPGNQAFVYRGTAFTGAAGDLLVQFAGGRYVAAGDVDGDLAPDFSIGIQSSTTPVAGWFIL